MLNFWHDTWRKTLKHASQIIYNRMSRTRVEPCFHEESFEVHVVETKTEKRESKPAGTYQDSKISLSSTSHMTMLLPGLYIKIKSPVTCDRTIVLGYRGIRSYNAVVDEAIKKKLQEETRMW